MPNNKGRTTLKRKKRAGNPMTEYDQLPPILRQWVADGILPWRAKSVQNAYEKALLRTGDETEAIKALNSLQSTLVAKDTARIWGNDHPYANGSKKAANA